jgi:hypothetical protein
VGSTNYIETFIRVAEDCPVVQAQVPKPNTKGPTIASLEYDLVADHPYELTSDDLLFEVYATRQEIPDAYRAEARAAFFAKSQACLRASPLPKRFGWGIHHDQEGRIALIGVGSDRYRELAEDPSIRQLMAMRSRRA